MRVSLALMSLGGYMQDYDDWKLSNAEDEEDAEDAKEQRRIAREHRKLQRHEDQEGER